MVKPCLMYIVRHGETHWNVQRRIQGQKESYLTKEGKRQAHLLKEHFAQIHFDAVYSSDLLRAKQTAKIINLEKKLAINTTQALRERSFGYLEGKYFREIKEQFFKLIPRYKEESLKQVADNQVSKIESDEEVVSRLITFLRELAVAYEGKTVLIITHGGLIFSLLVHLGHFSYEDIYYYKVKNTAYLVLASDGINFKIQTTNGIEKRA